MINQSRTLSSSFGSFVSKCKHKTLFELPSHIAWWSLLGFLPANPTGHSPEQISWQIFNKHSWSVFKEVSLVKLKSHTWNGWKLWCGNFLHIESVVPILNILGWVVLYYMNLIKCRSGRSLIQSAEKLFEHLR